MESNGMRNQQDLGMVGSTASFLLALLGAQAKWEGAAGIGGEKARGLPLLPPSSAFFWHVFLLACREMLGCWEYLLASISCVFSAWHLAIDLSQRPFLTGSIPMV